MIVKGIAAGSAILSGPQSPATWGKWQAKKKVEPDTENMKEAGSQLKGDGTGCAGKKEIKLEDGY